MRLLLAWLASGGFLACAEELPEDVADYRERCVLMNAVPIPVKPDDPHEGVKDVFACDVPADALASNQRPFPDGTVLVKESTREDADFPWLVATARKRNGQWVWDEYSRNFGDEPFLRILASEQVCVDCHKKVEAADWIYTPYSCRSELERCTMP